MSLMPKLYRGAQRSHDIISYILTANLVGVRNALDEDPYSINAIHGPSGMNAAMLCVAGRMPEFFDVLMNASGHLLDFAHEDHDGDDLQSLSIGTMSISFMDKVQDAYDRFAPHIINNWPSP